MKRSNDAKTPSSKREPSLAAAELIPTINVLKILP
jgi:hypothetical protein